MSHVNSQPASFRRMVDLYMLFQLSFVWMSLRAQVAHFGPQNVAKIATEVKTG